MAFIRAARVPKSVASQTFGPWEILRQPRFSPDTPEVTILLHLTDWRQRHGVHGECVMEDHYQELFRHLPIFVAARGRVLKTGLGLGCVVRGLLLKPEVEHIDVVEIDADIIRVIGAEFAGNPRVTIHHADALEWDPGDRTWRYAWHDIWVRDNDGLDLLHAALIAKYFGHAAYQGAWQFPRPAAAIAPIQLLGSPRRRRAA